METNEQLEINGFLARISSTDPLPFSEMTTKGIDLLDTEDLSNPQLIEIYSFLAEQVLTGFIRLPQIPPHHQLFVCHSIIDLLFEGKIQESSFIRTISPELIFAIFSFKTKEEIFHSFNIDPTQLEKIISLLVTTINFLPTAREGVTRDFHNKKPLRFKIFHSSGGQEANCVLFQTPTSSEIFKIHVLPPNNNPSNKQYTVLDESLATSMLSFITNILYSMRTFPNASAIDSLISGISAFNQTLSTFPDRKSLTLSFKGFYENLIYNLAEIISNPYPVLPSSFGAFLQKYDVGHPASKIAFIKGAINGIIQPDQ